jgi:hypothetical protein
MPFPALSKDYSKLVSVAIKKLSNLTFRNLLLCYCISEILENLLY